MEIYKCSTESGKNWYIEGWELLKKDPFKSVWVGLSLVLLPLVLTFFPLVGKFLAPLATSFLTLGFYVYAKNLEQNTEGAFKDLFVAFSDGILLRRLVPYLLASVAVSFIVNFVSSSGLALSSFWGTAVYLFWVAGTLYSLPLIYEGFEFSESVKCSLKATHKNWISFLLMATIGLVVLILCLIPLGLGLVIFIPLSHFVWYRSFKEIFPNF